jgi:hypothetical protein
MQVRPGEGLGAQAGVADGTRSGTAAVEEPIR